MKKLGFILTLVLSLAQMAKAAEASWLTDLAKAEATAKQEKKLVLLDFTGSDWCPPCKELHRRVFISKEFEQYAKDNLILVLVDFPRTHSLPPEQKQKNEDLAEKFQVSAFPTVIVLDSNGKALQRDEGLEPGLTAKGFVEKLQKLASKAKSS